MKGLSVVSPVNNNLMVDGSTSLPKESTPQLTLILFGKTHEY